MKENKTQKTTASPIEFLNSIPEPAKRADSLALLELMRQVSGHEPSMWGTAIVGFGDLRYRYASGREGDWFPIGFSPRKQNLTLYCHGGFTRFDGLLARLGKHKTGGGCLYINKLADINLDVLRELLSTAISQTSA